MHYSQCPFAPFFSSPSRSSQPLLPTFCIAMRKEHGVLSLTMSIATTLVGPNSTQYRPNT